jgi:Flp pilus assembly protein TadB
MESTLPVRFRRRLRRLYDRFRDVGSRDRVLDLFILAGPVVVAVVAVVGRTAFTEVLALAYVAGIVGYVLYRGVERRSRTRRTGRG